jgi:CBS domain-containing protein
MSTNADVTVREVMDREYVGVSESDALVETVELLLREESETAVVQRGSEPVGVLTERDVLATLVEGPSPEEATVGDVMTESVPTIDPDTTAAGAASELSTRSSRRLVVTTGGEPLGVVTERDLLAARAYRTGESDADATRREAITAMETATADVESPGPGPGDRFPDQSICERCGTLASDLASFNGQVLCPECRDL